MLLTPVHCNIIPLPSPSFRGLKKVLFAGFICTRQYKCFSWTRIRNVDDDYGGLSGYVDSKPGCERCLSHLLFQKGEHPISWVGFSSSFPFHSRITCLRASFLTSPAYNFHRLTWVPSFPDNLFHSPLSLFTESVHKPLTTPYSVCAQYKLWLFFTFYTIVVLLKYVFNNFQY